MSTTTAYQERLLKLANYLEEKAATGEPVSLTQEETVSLIDLLRMIANEIFSQVDNPTGASDAMNAALLERIQTYQGLLLQAAEICQPFVELHQSIAIATRKNG